MTKTFSAKRMTAWASAALLAVGLTACSPSDEAKEPSEGVALWKVADDDTTVYLFGTVHILQKDVEWKSPTFQAAWDSAKTVYFEADISPEAQAQIQALIPELGLNAPGTTLNSFLSEEGIANLEEICAQIGLPTANLQPLRPWLASLLISVQMVIAQGGDPEAGVESILLGVAKEDEKNLRYFETVEQQFRMLASPTDQDAAAALEAGLIQMKETPDLFKEIVTAWSAGDVAKMEALIVDSMTSSPETYEALFTTRNIAWAESLKTLLAEEEGTFFVAVGAGHLIGPDSVQAQLAKDGITSERQ